MGSVAIIVPARRKFGKVESRLLQLEQEFVANGGIFTEKRIGALFEIGTGSLIDSRKLLSGSLKRISAKSDNNGIIGEFDTENMEEARHFENFITVNFFGDVFYHPYRASVEMKVHTLKLREHTLTKGVGLYLVSLIRQRFMGKFGYGNQLSSSKLKNENFMISLPEKNGEIAFDYMEQVTQALQAERLQELQAYLRVTGLADCVLTDEENQLLQALAENPSGGGKTV